MKTTKLFRAIALAAIAITGIANAEMKAQENKFITNEVKEGELTTSKIIYRMDGSLHNHMKYDFAYDNQQRMTSREAYKWDGAKENWTPYFKITYTYSGNEIIVDYACWNAKKKVYDEATEKSVYEYNKENMPIAFMNYKWSESEKRWNTDIINIIDKESSMMVFAN